MIAALLSIAVYRVISSSPATASPVPEPAAVVNPSGPVAEAAPAPIQIESPKPVELVQPAAPQPAAPQPAATDKNAPQPARRVKPVKDDGNSVPPPPAAKNFVASPDPKPAPKAAAAPVVATDLPDVHEAPTAPSVVAVPASPSLAPPPDDEKGSRAGRVVRSVGRLFRFGRKDDGKEDAKQK